MTDDRTMNPDFFIVGAPKAGTTALDQYLSAHPGVFMAPLKEAHHFGRDLHKVDTPFFALARRKYLSLFRSAQPGQRVGESSVMYLYSQTAPAEILELNPDAQIVVMLRNPIDLMYSAHSSNLWGGYEDLPSFEDALDAEPARIEGRRIPRGAMLRETLFYRRLARCSAPLTRYLDAFGRDRVHIIIYDDFKADTAKSYRCVLDFLGADPDFLPSLKTVNANKRARIQALQSYIQYPPAMVRAMWRFIPDPAWTFVAGKLARLNTVFEVRPRMSPDTHRQLASELAEEVGMLSEIVKRDLTHWVATPSS